MNELEPDVTGAEVALSARTSSGSVLTRGDAFHANVAAVEARIAAACARAGRDCADVRLLPITKTVPAHILRLAYAAGVHAFGENKIQEATSSGRASWACRSTGVSWAICRPTR